MEWYEIVEGEHELWQGVSDPYKDTIRAFLVHFHTQVNFLWLCKEGCLNIIALESTLDSFQSV